MLLTKEEMKSYKGGSISAGVVAGVIAGVSFIVGILDGFTRPFRCR